VPHQHATDLPRDTGALSSYKNLRVEPADHGIGRSSGGLSTKIHQLVDGRGRPVCYDDDDYKGRNVIERGFNDTKQWRGLATRCDNSPLPTAAELCCEPSHSG
jgi:hypothetical protein